MYGLNSVLGLTFARTGSKGVPGKNLRPLQGKPLIAHAIEVGRGSRHIDRLIMSTDGPEIARIARAYGADVPFLRPPHLAEDRTPALAVLQHAVRWLAENGGEPYDAVVTIQTTTPVRTPGHIDRAIEIFFDQEADVVLGVVEVEHSPYWMFTESGGRLYSLLEPDCDVTSRQSVPPVYRVSGTVFVNRAEHLLDPSALDNVPLWELGEKTVPLIIDDPLARIDLDTEADFETLEALLERRAASPRSA